MSDDALPPEIAALIGVPQYEAAPRVTVNTGNVRAMCAAAGNANPAWWDADQSKALLGAAFAPPSMLPAWGRPDLWEPGRPVSEKALQAHFDLKDLLGYEASVAVSYTTSFYAAAEFGDQFHTRQIMREVGPIKTTRLGTGRFWTVEMEYLDTLGEVAGVESYVFFGFAKDTAA
ncbi:FAS1-like dehydratase domain-containing protein [Erythrobacter aurantius]|uniref:FAS1-like dehydratase domain-containing protein n=1 Tax=Erythrobacter aurantius TaxID=2909249 RepID=UPI0020795551|nr:MaoC family dehydratase N-terminal domain-containing protein [Erythrobacter aurantius]